MNKKLLIMLIGLSIGTSYGMSPQSPGEAGMRSRGEMRDLERVGARRRFQGEPVGAQLDPKVFTTLLPTPLFLTPPNLNLTLDQMVYRFTLDHADNNQKQLLNNIAQAMSRRQRYVIKDDELRSFEGFSVRVKNRLRKFASVPALDEAETELVEESISSESPSRSAKKRKLSE